MTRTYSPVTQVVAIGIGAALFIVLGLIRIPSPIPNTAISLQYALLAIFAVLYGPLVGFLAGLIGHIILDAATYGIWFSWELASGVFGLLVGLAMLRHHIHEGRFEGKDILRFCLAIVGAQLVAFLLIAPLGDILIYSEPASKVFVQGGFAVIVNSVTAAVIGGIVLTVYARTRTRSGSLSVDS